MHQLYLTLSPIHIAAGFISLILFWIPIFSRKGGKLHLKTGRWYSNAMYIVAGTGLVLSAMLFTAPIATKFPNLEMNEQDLAQVASEVSVMGLFLFAISVLVLTNIRQGLASLKAKNDHSLMRSPSILILNGSLLTMGLILAFAASANPARAVLFYIFAGLCTFTGIGNLRFCLRRQVPRMEWLIAHLSSMIGAGIASYTAFFVFGGQQFFSQLLHGYWAIVPWVAPGVVGGMIIRHQVSTYRNKYQAPPVKRPA